MANTSFLTPPLSPKSIPTEMAPSVGDLIHHSQHATGSSTPTSASFATPNGTTTGSSSPLTQILTLYHKATSTFLLRQLASAYSISLEALELLSKTNLDYKLDQAESVQARRSYFILKQKLWILHTTIFGAMLSDRTSAAHASEHMGATRKRGSGSSKDSPEKLVKDLWRRIVEDYGGLEGDVDGQVVVPLVLLCVNQKLFTLVRQIVEAYLATIPDGLLIHLETAAGVAMTPGGGSSKDPLITNYERLVELYLIHVLAKLNEWDYATDFLQYNSVLSDASKKTYGKVLTRLHQKSLRPKKKPVASPQQQHSSLDSLSKSSSAVSTSPSTASTSVSSPTLSLPSTMGSLSSSNALDDPRHVSSADAASSVFNDSTTTTPSSALSLSSGARSKVALTTTKKGSTAAISTVQGRFWILLQHYVDLIKRTSTQMGPNQLMIVVGLVVFLGTLSQNRQRVSRYWKAGLTKVMQTVKMGTTVTSI
ncbi:hypothetical protein BG011_001284 [Mortierella polycephala]|uniref:Uncharacterized protein n=1 Tax=Mortierella polycephala TaxID=41804 RepID=A0A9P6Q6S7_9FUNG|nr:hypothetical protein BG011_001284 [Mortierella polycephala]